MLRIGLGCMRLSAADDPDGVNAREVLAAALDAGIATFDTARQYGRHEGDAGHNERLVARAIRAAGAEGRVHVVTKGGMRRQDGRWIPDGRAATIRADAESSLEALGGLPIDTWLLHAPDPRTPWATSVRAMARLVDEGLVRSVGVSNVNRKQLDEALDLAPIAAVQAALGARDDAALRGGVVARCADSGLTLLAHSPLGGPARARRLAKDAALLAIARRHGVGVADVVLAWLLALDPCVVPLPGARRPQTARASAAAASIVLTEEDHAALSGRFPARVRSAGPVPAAEQIDGELVLLMGVQGAGKSEAARTWADRGYERLNRDERGGTLRGLARALEERVSAGARRVVLDNTYTTRASRRDVLEIASRHKLRVRGLWMDVPPVDAQINVILRMLDSHGRLLEPEEMQATASTPAPSPQFGETAGVRGPGAESLISPTAQLRMMRTLEPPDADEGFDPLVIVPFVRRPIAGRPACFVAAEAMGDDGAARRLAREDPEAPRLVFAWRPGESREQSLRALEPLARSIGAELAICPHPAGPPRCWCRPPLPGLLLAFARTHGVDPTRSVLMGTSAAHRAMAAALGARFEEE